MTDNSRLYGLPMVGDARSRLRNAIRACPDAPVFTGKKINDLTKSELIDVGLALGLDVEAILTINPPAGFAAPLRPARTVGEMVGDALATDAILHPVTPAETSDPEPGEGEPGEGEGETIHQEAEALRRELSTALVEGDFARLTARLEGLIAAAHKPPEVKVVQVPVPARDGTSPTVPAYVPVPAGTQSAGKLFGLRPPHASIPIQTYQPGPYTPEVDPNYIFEPDATAAGLVTLRRTKNLWLFGPAGTGKTSWAEQLAARTGRPFVLIPCDDTTEAPELVGMTVPHEGKVRWQDGALTAALRIPQAIVLIDEPTVARPGALMVLQSVLQQRTLTIKETGEVVRCAPGVCFIAADNTAGVGGGAQHGYEGTRRLNRATLSRFAAFIEFGFMPEQSEQRALIAHTGCTPQLAAILVQCAALTRKASVTHGVGLRGLIAWAGLLTDGIKPRLAFEYAVLNSAARDDREPIEQACALGLDKAAIEAALRGEEPPAPPADEAPTSAAAADFRDAP